MSATGSTQQTRGLRLHRRTPACGLPKCLAGAVAQLPNHIGGGEEQWVAAAGTDGQVSAGV